MTNEDIIELVNDAGGAIHRTLDDLIVKLRKADRDGYLGTLYRVEYSVEGVGEFPHDMLRYAASFPATESASRAIGDGIEHKRIVRLQKYARDKNPHLGEDRWRAYGWPVVAVHVTERI